MKETLEFLISIDFLKRFNPTGLNLSIATCFVVHTDPNPPLNITEENKAIITNESVSDNCYFHFFVIPLLFFRFNWIGSSRDHRRQVQIASCQSGICPNATACKSNDSFNSVIVSWQENYFEMEQSRWQSVESIGSGPKSLVT